MRQHRIDTQGEGDYPLPCRFKPCPFNYSELCISATHPWLELWKNLRSETIREGALAGFVLKKAGALNGEILELFAAFDSEVNRFQMEEREAARNRN